MSICFYPQLIAVEPLAPYRLRTRWSTGEILEVDVGDILKSIKSLAPILREDNFKKVHICECGHGIEWFDSEFGEDNVYAWGMEQQGQPSHEMFHVWLYRNKLSDAEAAKILGISERMVKWYATARKKVPWSVWLACAGYETLIKNLGSIERNSDDFKVRMVETSLKMFTVR